MKLIDISQKIQPDMLVYPGDPRYHAHSVSSFKQGDGCEVSELTLGSHCGTHVDAPKHMIPGGASVDQMPLECFYGPCRVITLPAAVISEKMIIDANIRDGERILLRTDPKGQYAASGRFNPSVLSMRAAQVLAEKKLCLLGIDAPTVENMEICDGEVHRTLLRAGVVILEGLCLDHVSDGEYILSAFPLSLPHENGSPCRAILIQNHVPDGCDLTNSMV